MHTSSFSSSTCLEDLIILPVITSSRITPNWYISSFSSLLVLHLGWHVILWMHKLKKDIYQTEKYLPIWLRALWSPSFFLWRLFWNLTKADFIEVRDFERGNECKYYWGLVKLVIFCLILTLDGHGML